MKLPTALLILPWILNVAGLCITRPGKNGTAPTLAANVTTVHSTSKSRDLRFNKAYVGAYPKLVWFFGVSIDSMAVDSYCNANHAAIHVILDTQYSNSDLQHAGSKWCAVNGLTIVFSLFPGATPPPYFRGWKSKTLATPHSIMAFRLWQIQGTFGKAPDAVIVDSSLWDVANWWQKDGSPQNWPMPDLQIKTWCESTIPAFLMDLQGRLPNSHIALRTIPPVFATRGSEWAFARRGPEIVSKMNSCLWNQHQLYGKYPLIDYNAAVHSMVTQWGGSMRQWYIDDLHPGPQLGVACVTVALGWARRVFFG